MECYLWQQEQVRRRSKFPSSLPFPLKEMSNHIPLPQPSFQALDSCFNNCFYPSYNSSLPHLYLLDFYICPEQNNVNAASINSMAYLYQVDFKLTISRLTHPVLGQEALTSLPILLSHHHFLSSSLLSFSQSLSNKFILCYSSWNGIWITCMNTSSCYLTSAFTLNRKVYVVHRNDSAKKTGYSS